MRDGWRDLQRCKSGLVCVPVLPQTRRCERLPAAGAFTVSLFRRKIFGKGQGPGLSLEGASASRARRGVGRQLRGVPGPGSALVESTHADLGDLRKDAEIKAVFNLADLMQMGVISEVQASV